MKTFLDRAVTAAKSVKERVEREFDDAIKDGAEKPCYTIVTHDEDIETAA